MENELIIYNTDDGKADVKLYSRDGVIWMNQQQMALLFDTSKQLVSHHIANILQDKELEEKSVVKDYLTTAADGKNYNVTYYALPMVTAVGFRVRSIRGTQFRRWANENLSEYLTKGFVMDDERLDNHNQQVVQPGIHTLTSYKNTYRPYFHENDSVLIKFAKIDKTTYGIYKAYNEMVALSSNPLFASDISMPTNIQGGQGFWCGYGVTKYSVVIADSINP